MAKPTKTLSPEDVFIEGQSMQLRSIAVPESLPEPVEYDDVTALNNVLAELGEDDAGGGFVTVFRETIDASGKKPDEYLERFPASEFSLDNLKARWGAGKYKISVYQDGRILTRKVITIARDPNVVTMLSAAPQATDLTPVLSAIQQSNEKMVAAIMALAQEQANKQPSRTEMLEEMRIMREMFAPAPGSAQPAYNPVEMMKLGVEMASRGMGGEESNNAWVSKVIDQLGPVLMPALASSIAPKQPATVPTTAHPTVALPAPTPRPETSTQQEEDPVNLFIVNYLAMLTRAAEKKAPVEEYADSILSTVPTSNIPDLEAMLSPADWRDKIKQYTQAVEKYPEWFTQLRDTLLIFIDEDKAALSGEATTHLTPELNAGSVSDHVDDITGKPTGNTGDASGAA